MTSRPPNARRCAAKLRPVFVWCRPEPDGRTARAPLPLAGHTAADKPLTFLDHHLLAGNSLVGATPDDLRRLHARPSHRPRREELPLLDRAGLTAAFEYAVGLRLRLTSEPDDSAAIVRAKEQALAALHSPDSSLHRWVRALDLGARGGSGIRATRRIEEWFVSSCVTC